MHDWRDKGTTNHILINRVMEYPRSHLFSYFLAYADEYSWRNIDKVPKCYTEFLCFRDSQEIPAHPFPGWHDDTYLRICMANLYEKHIHGRGSSRITDAEWNKLKAGYYHITGDVYQI